MFVPHFIRRLGTTSLSFLAGQHDAWTCRKQIRQFGQKMPFKGIFQKHLSKSGNRKRAAGFYTNASIDAITCEAQDKSCNTNDSRACVGILKTPQSSFLPIHALLVLSEEFLL